MGMAINSIIIGLQSIKAFLDYSEFKGLEEQTKVQCFVLDEAIDTTRKYQKIEQIYQKWNEVNDFSYNQAMREIGEVLEDG